MRFSCGMGCSNGYVARSDDWRVVDVLLYLLAVLSLAVCRLQLTLLENVLFCPTNCLWPNTRRMTAHDGALFTDERLRHA